MNRLKDPRTPTEPHLRIPPISWEWDKTDYAPDWHEPLFEVMARYVPGGSRILEVGAGGSATFGMLTARLDCRACGCEPDVAGIITARRLAEAEGATPHFTRGDGFSLPFANETFDVVYSLGLIEHFSSAESSALISKHRRVCRPGGRVIISVPNLLNLPHTLTKAVQGKRGRYYPERSFSPRRLRALMEGAGLRLIARDGLLPLWGVSMIQGGWRVIAMLNRLGIGARLGNPRRPRLRAIMGYMTFAVGECPA